MNEKTSAKDKNNVSAEEPELIEIQFGEIFRAFRKFWWLCLLLVVACGGLMFLRSYINYTPTYQSSVTFTVQTQEVGSSGLGLTSYSFSYNRATTNQLSTTFPNIIKSNILQDVICNDLGLSYFPCTLSASSVSGTNMFTITATGYDAQLTYDVLQSVIKNYPAVAEYVIGNTVLNILNESEIPTVPSNRFAYRSQVLKGALLGFAIGLVWVVLYATFRQTVRSRDDIRRKLNQHCLGVLPEVTFRKYNKKINRTISLTNPLVGEGYLESVRALRNSVLNALSANQKVIMITSAAPAEGKTSAAVNIASSLAMMKKNVIVVDADLRNPNVNQKFRISNNGLDANDVHRAKIMKVQASQNLTLSILNFNTARYKIWDLMNVEYLSGLFEQLRRKYDYIIIDTSPLGITSEPSVLASVSDAALFVVKQDSIRISRLVSVIDTLLAADVPLIGCVLNNATSESVGYGSHYGYRYGYRYGRYGKYGGYHYSSEKSKKE